jgi:hypothetical protein
MHRAKETDFRNQLEEEEKQRLTEEQWVLPATMAKLAQIPQIDGLAGRRCVSFCRV